MKKCRFERIPSEITRMIVSCAIETLKTRELVRVRAVCREFKLIADENFDVYIHAPTSTFMQSLDLDACQTRISSSKFAYMYTKIYKRCMLKDTNAALLYDAVVEHMNQSNMSASCFTVISHIFGYVERKFGKFVTPTHLA